MTPAFDVQQQLEAELDSGERIAWQEKAQPRFLAARSIFPGLFAIVWLSIVMTGIFSDAHGRHASSPPPFFMFVPFAFIGLLFIGMPVYQYLSARNTYYLITNRRALIITLGSRKKVLTYYPDKLQSLERRERADGRGDLVIDRVSGGASTMGFRNNAYVQEVGFLNIPDVKNVEAMLRDLARKDRNARV
jgi:hypothetical protein